MKQAKEHGQLIGILIINIGILKVKLLLVLDQTKQSQYGAINNKNSQKDQQYQQIIQKQSVPSNFHIKLTK